MSTIVLSTLNAKYAHSAFGLRYLLANLGELQASARLMEFTINDRPIDIVEHILAAEPQIVGFGVYIWNVTTTTDIIRILKAARPDITVILGGPEVSYETEGQDIVACADYVVTGEGEVSFKDLVERLVSGNPPAQKIIHGMLPDVEQLTLPYSLYDKNDIAHRVLYVEASRGCPYKCEFCLSSLDQKVRQVPLDAFLSAMQTLVDQGARQFKFIDRTFNLNINTGRAILEFFLNNWQPDMFLHFEMVPDRLPSELRELISRFPPGALQFEIGIQTFNPDVCKRISRRQNDAKLAENFNFLRSATGVHIHADLIVGLPGEDIDSFAQGFDRLVALDPQEIQVGILKRLRGVPIIRHDAEWQVAYSPVSPYEILRNRVIDFATMQRLKRFARYWDLVANSGNFRESRALLLGDKPFYNFLEFSDWLYKQTKQTAAISLERLAQYLLEFLLNVRSLARADVAPLLLRDYQRSKPRRIPPFLADDAPDMSRAVLADFKRAKLPERQARHQ